MGDDGAAQPEPTNTAQRQRAVELAEEIRKGLDQVAMVSPPTDAVSPEDAVAAAEPEAQDPGE